MQKVKLSFIIRDHETKPIVTALYRTTGIYVSRTVNAIKMESGQLFLLVEAAETWKLNEVHDL